MQSGRYYTTVCLSVLSRLGWAGLVFGLSLPLCHIQCMVLINLM